MRTFVIILSDIPNETSDLKFGGFVDEKKLEYWRYTALNWILLTPDDISTATLVNELFIAYGEIFLTVLEVDLKDAGGVFPTTVLQFNGVSPFDWFRTIKEKNFVPRWLRETV